MSPLAETIFAPVGVPTDRNPSAELISGTKANTITVAPSNIPSFQLWYCIAAFRLHPKNLPLNA